MGAAVEYGGRLLAFSLLPLAVFALLGLGFGLGGGAWACERGS